MLRKQNIKTERRREPRVEYPAEAFFKIGPAGNEQGKIIDISRTGLYLCAEKKFRMGKSALVYVPFQDGRKKVICFVAGRIVYTRDHLAEGEVGYAIEFDSTLPYATRKTLEKIVGKKLEEEISRAESALGL